MTRITNNRPDPPKGPIPKVEKKPKLTRQVLMRMTNDARYLAIRDAYLFDNQLCAKPGCEAVANQVHHVCRGVHRAASLTNPETWLPVCSPECHDWIEKQPIRLQVLIKLLYTEATIERLRR